MRSSKIFIMSLAAISVLFLISCEDADDRKIASAQKCLNGIGDRTGTDLSNYVQSCMDKIAGMNNEQANIIFCSGYFLKGGLTNSKIISAFGAYNDAPSEEKEAVLIKQLSLGDSSVPDAKANADAAYHYCQKTNVPGLAYVASLCRIGTYVDQMNCGGSCADIRDAIDHFVGNIGSGASDADKQAVGEMVNDLSTVYCQGEAKESNICIEINSAKQAANGDLVALAEILLNQFLY